ncbi:MAG: DEAD/DEAH box helicase [Pseudomonadales bacterium]|nr:DEAD/DEAH box helicase [Pseudomonadales bacterium]
MSFDSLGLSSEILAAVTEKGYKTPSLIQEKAIPVILQGKDILAAAQTGSGKTAGFVLPILQLLSKGKKAGPNKARTLILTPTRELAAQIYENVQTYSKYLDLKANVIFGGVKPNPQMMKLRRGTDVLVATPGRLLDLINQRAVSLNELEILVLDEADRMLDMGFIHDIKRIIKMLPPRRQTLLFSATFSAEIRKLAKQLVNNPVEISATPKNQAAPTIIHKVHPVDKSKKPALLVHLIKSQEWTQALVFTRTKHGANRLVKYIENNGITAAAIHGNKSQGARTRALAEFKANEIRILVATDIAARGIDIHQLPQVVNFELPNVAEDYVHRIGRTGRAGRTGNAVSLVCNDEFKDLSGIEKLIQSEIERVEVEGFKPVNVLPASNLAKKAKKPKKFSK